MQTCIANVCPHSASVHSHLAVTRANTASAHTHLAQAHLNMQVRVLTLHVRTIATTFLGAPGVLEAAAAALRLARLERGMMCTLRKHVIGG